MAGNEKMPASTARCGNLFLIAENSRLLALFVMQRADEKFICAVFSQDQDVSLTLFATLCQKE